MTSICLLVVPNSFATISYGAFKDCSALTALVLPDSITTIGVSAFRGCSGLTSLILPESVTKIDYLAFAGCTGLSTVIVYRPPPPPFADAGLAPSRISGTLQILVPHGNATGPADNLFGGDGRSEYHVQSCACPPPPHWVDFGKNMEHSPDGKAYLVSHSNDDTSNGSDGAWTLGNQVFMARVSTTVSAINDKSQTQSVGILAGGHGTARRPCGCPAMSARPRHWSTGPTTRAAPRSRTLPASESTSWRPGHQHRPHLRPYSTAATLTLGFSSPTTSTGPWSYVTYMKQFGPQVKFANFPPQVQRQASQHERQDL